jgi:hypothetical protein
MNDHLTLKLEGDAVRFTPNGRIAVIDAIGALCEEEHPDTVWEALKRRRPQVATLCEPYTFAGGGPVPVADGAAWMTIQTLLLDHIIDAQP